jgi:hypothetical protein
VPLRFPPPAAPPQPSLSPNARSSPAWPSGPARPARRCPRARPLPDADGWGPPVIRLLAPPPRLATEPGSSLGWTPTRRPCRVPARDRSLGATPSPYLRCRRPRVALPRVPDPPLSNPSAAGAGAACSPPARRRFVAVELTFDFTTR